MASIGIKRPILNTLADYSATIVAGAVSEVGDSFYLPFSLDSFSAPDLSITGVSVTSGQSRINGSAGKFDNVRVGDIIGTLSAGALTAKTAITVDNCYTLQGQFYIVYPHTVNLSSVGVKAGDAVSGGGIAVGAKVDKINYDTRQIFLTLANTASGVQTAGNIVTFTPPVRVTAVRPSTATTNANQIDIDTTVATTAANTDVTITPGAGEAVVFILKVTPTDNTTGSLLSNTVEYSLVPGTSIVGSASGYSGLDFTTLSYLSLPAIKFDLDGFLTAARLPRPVSV